ncbi:hypothetical protein KPH14_006267 [Odynerus spinipes]|uniref:Uncharacterized protein n=1 Tax=Odynerus spinipes TaxID=1348599 RepID=A0AAD9VKH2_9HYME|nr:hypothetical protein KPH14_006267 [Odynerus spinipes]
MIFLIDTRSAVNLIRWEALTRKAPVMSEEKLDIIGVSGKAITTLGTTILTAGEHQAFFYVVKDTSWPYDGILGVAYFEKDQAEISFHHSSVVTIDHPVNPKRFDTNRTVNCITWPEQRIKYVIPGKMRQQIAINIDNTELTEGYLPKLKPTDKVVIGENLVFNHNGTGKTNLNADALSRNPEIHSFPIVSKPKERQSTGDRNFKPPSGLYKNKPNTSTIGSRLKARRTAEPERRRTYVEPTSSSTETEEEPLPKKTSTLPSLLSGTIREDDEPPQIEEFPIQETTHETKTQELVAELSSTSQTSSSENKGKSELTRAGSDQELKEASMKKVYREHLELMEANDQISIDEARQKLKEISESLNKTLPEQLAKPAANTLKPNQDQRNKRISFAPTLRQSLRPTAQSTPTVQGNSSRDYTTFEPPSSAQHETSISIHATEICSSSEEEISESIGEIICRIHLSSSPLIMHADNIAHFLPLDRQLANPTNKMLKELEYINLDKISRKRLRKGLVLTSRRGNIETFTLIHTEHYFDRMTLEEFQNALMSLRNAMSLTGAKTIRIPVRGNNYDHLSLDTLKERTEQVFQNFP